MKKMLLVMLLVIAAALHAQTPASQNISAPQKFAQNAKFALVIGNGAYKDLAKPRKSILLSISHTKAQRHEVLIKNFTFYL